MIGILGLNRGRLGGMRPGFIMCLWSDGEGFVANIVLHSDQIWRDLRELHKLAELFIMLKIKDFDQNKRCD
jgi:hypothetical protein